MRAEKSNDTYRHARRDEDSHREIERCQGPLQQTRSAGQFVELHIEHGAFFFETDGGSHELGVGLGSLVLLLNVVCLTAFTFGCNSARHLVGGNLDCFSCSAFTRARHGVWKQASLLNEHHMAFAWMSFVTVCSADLYVRLVAAGVIHDLRLL